MRNVSIHVIVPLTRYAQLEIIGDTVHVLQAIQEIHIKEDAQRSQRSFQMSAVKKTENVKVNTHVS
jgi:hypothetical protein